MGYDLAAARIHDGEESAGRSRNDEHPRNSFRSTDSSTLGKPIRRAAPPMVLVHLQNPDQASDLKGNVWLGGQARCRLKAAVIMVGDGCDSSFGRNLHPPIDRILFRGLASSDRITSSHEAACPSVNWTQLDQPAYDRLNTRYARIGDANRGCQLCYR